MDNKIPFSQWMRDVDKAISLLVGLISDDLPDWCYRDAYDEGLSAKVAARKAIRSAGEL